MLCLAATIKIIIAVFGGMSMIRVSSPKSERIVERGA